MALNEVRMLVGTRGGVTQRARLETTLVVDCGEQALKVIQLFLSQPVQPLTGLKISFR